MVQRHKKLHQAEQQIASDNGATISGDAISTGVNHWVMIWITVQLTHLTQLTQLIRTLAFIFSAQVRIYPLKKSA